LEPISCDFFYEVVGIKKIKMVQETKYFMGEGLGLVYANTKALLSSQTPRCKRGPSLLEGRGRNNDSNFSI
jgi:hypothetical protein